jgi:hypothetical protein
MPGLEFLIGGRLKVKQTPLEIPSTDCVKYGIRYDKWTPAIFTEYSLLSETGKRICTHYTIKAYSNC